MSKHKVTSKILIVEDNYDTLQEIKQLLDEVSPKLSVDSALTENDAIAFLENATLQGRQYDMVLLDYKLPPSPGEEPQVNQAIYSLLREKTNKSVVIHTTAYPYDATLMERILEEAKQSPLKPRSVFLSKTDPSWTYDLLDVISDVVLEESSTTDQLRFQSCFISYSHEDEDFVQVLYPRLKSEGIQLWYAAEHMQPGHKIHEEIENNIGIFDKLLLVLSEHSMKSNWVASEIRTAIREEGKSGKRKLFPIRLVGYEKIQEWHLFNADVGKDMAVELREYFIPDFSDWRDTIQFERAIHKLLDGLRIQIAS